MLDIQWILSFLLLGAFVGLMAGLLGIGGGGIMVPLLASIFIHQGVAVDNVVHLALGTSMASIIFTSLSSMRAHNARRAVNWQVVKNMAPGIVMGTFLATFVAAYLSSLFLAIFFSAFMGIVAIQMFLSRRPDPNAKMAGKKELFCVGSGIGGVSALVSVGGGALTVPYLIRKNLNVQNAIGTSAAIGVPISVVGTLGYLINGWGASIGTWSLGFVYLPAVLLISVVSFFTAPYGAMLAHKLPVNILKKVFAILLISLSIKMLTSVI